jgi:16S rRNA (cytosine967-C5)-methyltransferase
LNTPAQSKPKSDSKFKNRPLEPGLLSRRLAASVLADVVQRRLALDERLDAHLATPEASEMNAQDRSLVRAIATSAVRRLGTVKRALYERLLGGMPQGAPKLEPILISAVAQILFLGVPDHAAVDTAVRLAREDSNSMHFVPLANAVLRRIAREKDSILKSVNPLRDDTPEWLAKRWFNAYGGQNAVLIAASHQEELAIDLTVKSDAQEWADRLGGVLLLTGSIRLKTRESIATLPGYEHGEWWVQDAAAAIPAKLMMAQAGKRVLDLCAAPGGKTAQLASLGANVVAMDRSDKRLVQLRNNMTRLKLEVEVMVADALVYEDELFDSVLIDAPCSATGTIRRHPDVAWTKTQEDILKLVALQRKMLDRAHLWLKSGGILVYSTCSLERDEGEAQIEGLLKRDPRFSRMPVAAEELGGMSELITEHGDVRALPFHFAAKNEGDNVRLSGCDGFYAARLVFRGA